MKYSCLSVMTIFLLLLGGPFSSAAVGGEETITLFHQANRQYLAGEYQVARDHYLKLKQSLDSPSWSLHYNLGNTYFRLGDSGQAIFHYLMAKKLAPRQAEVLYNLNYVRGQMERGVSSNPKTSIFLLPLSGQELMMLLSLLLVMLALFVVVLNYHSYDWARWGRNLVAILLIYPLAYSGKLYLKNPNFGVVVAPEASVYSGSGVDNVVLFKLASGAEFELLDGGSDLQKQWFLVRLADDKQGWIHREQIEISIE